MNKGKLHLRANRNIARISISVDEELADKFKAECDNNFIEPKIFTVKLGQIQIKGSGTYSHGAKYSEVIKKLILEFLKTRDPFFVENYIKKLNTANEKK